MARAAQIDAYGTYGDATCMADFLELLALKNKSITEARLADAIADSSLEHWTVRPSDWFIDAGQTRDEKLDETDSSESSERVFAQLAQRETILGDRYPFRLVRGRPEYVSAAAPSASPYCALLGITTVHAYKLAPQNDAPNVFEDTVENALNAAGIRTVNLARHRRGVANFDDAVVAAGTSIGMEPTPSAATRRLAAQDESVDTISHLNFLDGRRPSWSFLGQATCARTNDWKRKLGEPPRELWAGYLNVGIRPNVFLAIPHHAEDAHLEYLVGAGYDGMVLDRLRLCLVKPNVRGDEARLLQLVLDEDWESPDD